MITQEPRPAPQRRKPRFRRARTRRFQVTQRDLDIIRAVERHRLLSSEHIVRLFPEASKQNILRRLQLLYHGRYLDRPALQIADFRASRLSTPMVYALGAKGHELLAAETGGTARPDWSAKNRSLKPTFYKHTLMVSGILIAFEAACRKRGDVRLIPWEEILTTKCPPEIRKKAKHSTWRVRIPGKGTVGITPDAVFGLHFLDQPEGANRTYFFLEADRGSMPVVRQTFTQTAVYKKLLAYHATATAGLHTKLFGFKTFRVLTVTDSPERGRVASMVKACAGLSGLQGIFLFTDEASLLAGDALSHGWVNGRGKGVGLIP